MEGRNPKSKKMGYKFKNSKNGVKIKFFKINAHISYKN